MAALMPSYCKGKMRYTNIKLIMDRLTRNELLRDIPFETVVDYAVEFIKIVGAPPSFLEKTALVEIDQYRGQLPCDFYEMIQVRTAEPHNEHPHAFRYSTDSFHMSPRKPKWSDLTYKIQGTCIFTSLKKGMVEIAYRAIGVDEEGYPLIPDNGSYDKALELYIKVQYFTGLFEQGKITQQVLDRTEQQYTWYVGQAQTDLIRPTVDQMEAISNMWNKLLPDVTQDHRHGFVDTGTREHIITH